jgi:hypothetical protein
MTYSSFLAVMALRLTDGFPSTTNAPFAVPFGPEGHRPQIAHEDDGAKVFKAKKWLKNPRYDMGIGKNGPVLARSEAMTPSTASNEFTGNDGRFIIEYESVRPFPAPLLPELAPKMKVLPKVKPRRNAQDILNIDSTSSALASAENYHPMMVPVLGDDVEPIKLDPNTVWVEMMLHDEMRKLVSRA